MFKNVMFAHPELKNLLNSSGYDTLIIEEVRFRCDWKGTCEPIVIGRLSGPLSEDREQRQVVKNQASLQPVVFKRRIIIPLPDLKPQLCFN